MAGAEEPVQLAGRIGKDRERNAQAGAIGGETVGFGEGHHGDRRVGERVEVITYGDHALLARQSSEVAVQDQHDGLPPLLSDRPSVAVVVDEFDVGDQIADAQCHAAPLGAGWAWLMS